MSAKKGGEQETFRFTMTLACVIREISKKVIGVLSLSSSGRNGS